MPKITFKLLQAPLILLDGKVVQLPFKKAEALLYCLAIKKSMTREQAAALLWDADDAQVSKKNLRHTLYTIKKAFDLEIIVSPKKPMLALNPELTYDIDYDRFLANDGLELYENELLQGFDLKNAEAFEEWLSLERISLKDSYLRRLYDRMLQTPQSNISAMEALFFRYTKEDPLEERIYLLMMECYQKNNLFHKGIKVYQNISKLLNNELRIAPCAELTALHRELLSSWTESSTAEPEPEATPIIGRTKELQYLMKTYHSFLLGTPTALCLLGDNGVGKTYLMNHFLDHLDGDACIVLRTICFQAEREFTLQPWNSIMLQLDSYIHKNNIHVPASYMSHISNLFPLFGDNALSSQVPEDVMTSYNYRTTRNSILKLFSLIGEETPIVLFFDNLQFMDTLSLELLSLIIRERNPNLFCIGTCLDVQPPLVQKQLNALVREKFLTQLVLEPFSEQSVADIIADRLGAGALNEQIIHHIYQDSEGNGFFLDMLLSYLSSDNTNKLSLPANPQEILLERVEELSTDSRQMLDTISICPSYITLEIVEFIFNRDTLEIIELIDDLKQHGLVKEKVAEGQIRFQFRHNKMQDFVHSLLSPAKRRLLHARVATYYEQATVLHNNSWYQSLIYHYAQAGNDAKVLQYKILSLADYSRFNYELYPILQPQKDSDLEAPKQLTTYFDQLTAELIRLYNYQPTAIDFSELESRLYLVVGKYYISQGEYKKGIEAIHRGLAQSRYLEEHPEIHISYLRQLTFYGIQTWNTELMRENIEKSMGIASAHRLNTEYATECRLYGLYLSMCGRYEEAREKLQQAISLFQTSPLEGQSYALNVAACYNYLGEAERKQSHFAASLDFYDRAIEICSDRRYPQNPTFFANKARTLWALGQKEEAASVFLRANELYDASTILVGRAITKSYCARIWAARGDAKNALKLIDEAKNSAQMIQSPISLGIVAHTQAVLLKLYPEIFSSALEHSAADYDAAAEELLRDLPGAYERKEPLSPLPVTI